MVTERNDTSSSRNARPSTKPNTHGRLLFSWALKSAPAAASPVTRALAPKVAGTTRSRSTVSAAGSGRPTETIATVPAGLVRTSIGSTSPAALAADRNEATFCWNALPRTVGVWTTTWAGVVLLGKAASIAVIACTIDALGGRSASDCGLVCRFSTGAARAARAPTATMADSSGLASTTRSTAFHTRPSLRRRYRPGILTASTLSPRAESSAGSTVSEPSTAVATTRMVPTAKLVKVASMVRNMPDIATITVRPEIQIERPEVCAAITRARCGSAPLRRSSRSRRM